MKIFGNFEFLILNFKLNSKLKTRNVKFIFVALALFLISNGRAQQNAAGQGDFVSTEYFEPPHQQERKTQLSGTDAQPLAGGLLELKNLKLEMFNLDGKKNFIAQAPECIYDAEKNSANSAGNLDLQTGDGKLRVSGDGFLWREVNQILTISNNVRTTIMALATAAGVAASAAQTNINSIFETPRGQTKIDSDSADFDMTAHTAIYRGHVRVNDPQMQMTCALLTANLPPDGGRVNHIVAETNVVINFTQNGRLTHALGQKAVYDYSAQNGATNETVTLTGNPEVESVEGGAIFTNHAETIIWDRINDSFRFINYHANYQNLNSTETNSPAEKTNLPPGAIDNIDRIYPSQGPSQGF